MGSVTDGMMKKAAEAENNMEELIDDFIKKLREKSSSTVTAVQIFVSGSDSEIVIKKRTPEELRRDGISMTNLKGEWIK